MSRNRNLANLLDSNGDVKSTALDNDPTTLSDLGVTATSTEINLLDGVTATTAELNYIDGVTSAIQTQIDSKQATLTAGTDYLTPTGDGSGLTGIDALPSQTGNSDKYLTTDGSSASWQEFTTYLGVVNRSGSSIEVSLSSPTTLGILNRDGSTTTSVSLSV